MRWVIGPQFSRRVDAPVPPPPAKADIGVSLSLEGDVLELSLPPYDLATHNRLSEVRAYLLPTGQPAPGTADEWVGSPLPFAASDVSGLQGGGDVPITLPTVEPGDYVGQVVLGFES